MNLIENEIENFIVSELVELKKEKLINDFHFSSLNEPIFKIVTLEGINFEIEYLRESGYRIVNFPDNVEIIPNSKNIHETFESLLRDISKNYEETFIKTLFKKLQDLEQEKEDN